MFSVQLTPKVLPNIVGYPRDMEDLFSFMLVKQVSRSIAEL